MAITSIKTGSSFTNLTKYDSFLAGNTAFNPSSYESIATVNPTSGTTVTFTSIPATYQHLQIRGIARDTYTGAGQLSLRIYFNTINTPSSTSYADHYLMGNGTSASAVGASAAANFIVQSSEGSDADIANTFAASIIDIHDYASTTKNKTVRYLAGYNFNSTSTDASVSLGSGLWVSTSAITSITLISNAVAYKTGTTFALYGIKG
jgi:hypothetical protein